MVTVKSRAVFDPRDGATRRSSNPVLHLRAYLLDAEYGRLRAEEIDDAAFAEAAPAGEGVSVREVEDPAGELAAALAAWAALPLAARLSTPMPPPFEPVEQLLAVIGGALRVAGGLHILTLTPRS